VRPAFFGQPAHLRRLILPLDLDSLEQGTHMWATVDVRIEALHWDRCLIQTNE
jgi:hypothetical protein